MFSNSAVSNSAVSQPVVSILIVQSHANMRLGMCIESLRQKVTVAYEIVVVASGVASGAVDPILNRCHAAPEPAAPEPAAPEPAAPEPARPDAPISLIQTSEALTFAAANNLAARHASGEFLLLLSEDAVLLTDIEDAARALDADPTLGAIGAERYSHQGAYLVSCAHFPAPVRLWRFASMWHIPSTTWKVVGGVSIRRCDYVDGSFLLTRAKLWQRVGGMAEANTLYGDEMDYCRSLFDAGHLTAQCPPVHYAHGGEYSPARLGHIAGGFRRYHRRFSGRFTRLHAEFALRGGLLLRLPLYWWKSRRGNEASRIALEQVLRLHREWKNPAAITKPPGAA